MKSSNYSKVWSIPSDAATPHIFLLPFLTILILKYVWFQIHFSEFQHFDLFCDQCGSEENKYSSERFRQGN